MPLHSFMNRMSHLPYVSLSQGVLCSCRRVEASLTPRISRSFFSRAVWASKVLRDTVDMESFPAGMSVIEIRCCLLRSSIRTPRHGIPLAFWMAVHKHSICLDSGRECPVYCD